MTKFRIAGLLLALAAASASAGRACAAADDAAIGSALQSVVSRQLEALGRGDGAAAEGFAAPGVREKFPDPAQFLAMVRSRYAALINPQSESFGSVADSPHGPLQTVTVIAADGSAWSAIYSFEKVGEDWRITSVSLERDKTQQAI